MEKYHIKMKIKEFKQVRLGDVSGKCGAAQKRILKNMCEIP